MLVLDGQEVVVVARFRGTEEIPEVVAETWERVLSYQSNPKEVQDMILGEWVAYRIVEEQDEDDAGVYLMTTKEFDHWVEN